LETTTGTITNLSSTDINSNSINFVDAIGLNV
jgi:hypothetical protein